MPLTARQVGREREAHGGVADRVRRELEARGGEALHHLRHPRRVGPERARCPRRACRAPPARPCRRRSRRRRRTWPCRRTTAARARRAAPAAPPARRRSCPASATAARAGAWSARRVPSRSRRRSCVAGSPSITCAPVRPERVQPPQLLDVAGAQLGPAQPRRGAQHEVLRARLAQLARRHAVDADDLRAVRERVRAGDVGELERARAWRAPCAGPRAARTPPRRDRLADLLRRRRRVVVQPPGEQPAALWTAPAASAASTASRVRQPLRSVPRASSAPQNGCRCESTRPGMSALPRASRTSVRASQCARTSSLVADGDDRAAAASRPRSRTAAPGRASGRAR